MAAQLDPGNLTGLYFLCQLPRGFLHLECVEKGTLWAVHTVKTLPSTNFGRVAIVGDPAHAKALVLARVSRSADAYLLMTVLGHKSTTLETVPMAPAIYDKLRSPFSSEVALRSIHSG
ncbi:hypothetical protein DFJ58DRAFT_729703 [Suillus subalutaceus]|uniref:uncharacterized protein n=1 Tax=Suillus subalutaceus TaxID=48586 RepID=UPI001B882B02|nr:uncharacterized protein DFJ58DRAFT_729703 [Suillus subalutaceus]KAG1848944.1 hypothetical protein DFJ58DRAFT_729703 [Suillus subalutaceus]